MATESLNDLSKALAALERLREAVLDCYMYCKEFIPEKEKEKERLQAADRHAMATIKALRNKWTIS